MSESFHPQKHRNVAGSWYRASVFGVSDGLVTNASLILGFAGANPGHDIVRLAGLAGLVAGGFSMASGEYISVRAQKELLEYEIDVERKSIEESPDQEQEELRQLFVERGIEAELARRLSVDLMRDPEMALRTHAREELGVDPSTTGSPWGAAVSSLFSFAVGAFIPLLPVDRDLDGRSRGVVDRARGAGRRGRRRRHRLVHAQRHLQVGAASGRRSAPSPRP